MKKVKLLLLVGMFALLGIFNFSSAYSLTENISFLPSTTYVFPSSLVGQRVSVTCSGQDRLQLNFSCAGGYFGAGTASKNNILITEGCKIQSYGATASCSYSYNSPNLPFNQLFVLLSPAGESLKITIYQLIPLVVYIGIGLLVVTLGFYCIKWLVYWIYNKLNSVFSSRK